MNLSCYDNFIGIRSEKDAETPSSGLYLDELPGIDLKRMANIASSGSGSELINRAIKTACDDVAEEALNNGDAPNIATSELGYFYIESKFRTSVLENYNGDRGIEFDIRRPDFYQYSNLHIRRIHLKAAENAGGVIVKIVDGNNETELDTVDLVAGETKTIELDYQCKNNKVQIVTDHSDIQYYQAYLPSDFNKCYSCGSGAKSNSYAPNLQTLWISGGHGISADMAMECNTDKIKCFLLKYLKYPILYKAAMNLAIEGEQSDRLNFYAANTDFESFYAYNEIQYEERLKRVLPNLMRNIKPFDKNCFRCGGTVKTKIEY